MGEERPLDARLARQVIDFDGLGRLLREAGVEPERVEAMIRECLVSLRDDEVALWYRRELEALQHTLEEGLRASRSDQSFSLSGVALVMQSIRSEAAVYQGAFARAMNRTSVWLACVVVLQLAIIAGLIGFHVMQPEARSGPPPAAGSAAGPPPSGALP